MTTARKIVLAAAAAALVAAVVPPGPVLAGEEPELVVSADGTICYERVKEGNSNRVIVTMSGESKQDVVVTMHTEDGTAKSPDDYQGFERLEVVIKAGQTRVEVPLSIVDDRKEEPDEYFVVIIDSVQGAAIGNGKAEVVIKDGAPPRSGK